MPAPPSSPTPQIVQSSGTHSRMASLATARHHPSHSTCSHAGHNLCDGAERHKNGPLDRTTLRKASSAALSLQAQHLLPQSVVVQMSNWSDFLNEPPKTGEFDFHRCLRCAPPLVAHTSCAKSTPKHCQQSCCGLSRLSSCTTCSPKQQKRCSCSVPAPLSTCLASSVAPQFLRLAVLSVSWAERLGGSQRSETAHVGAPNLAGWTGFAVDSQCDSLRAVEDRLYCGHTIATAPRWYGACNTGGCVCRPHSITDLGAAS